MHKPILLLGASLLALSSAAEAIETITYSYDARGRIVEASTNQSHGILAQRHRDTSTASGARQSVAASRRQRCAPDELRFLKPT